MLVLYTVMSLTKGLFFSQRRYFFNWMRPGWSVKKLKPSPHSVEARLPKVYKDFLAELKKEPAPVHYIPEPGKWKISTRTATKIKIENVPIPLKFPKEADEGIWGGEGVIQGFVKYKKKRRRAPQFWIPTLKRAVVYSEILNKYMSVTVTERTLQLIDKHFGFDNYILETPVQDLKSQLALDIRRKMLLTLANKEKCYDDMSQQEKVWNKYSKFEIPKEEAEWFGLSLKEAIKKQKLIEEETKPLPLKHQYRKLYFEELKEKASSSPDVTDRSDSWLAKIPFLGRGKQAES